MPRIGRSFPPQWSEPNIGGSERALGPEPPQVLAQPPFAPISVNLATGLLTNQRRAQQRRPRPLGLEPPQGIQSPADPLTPGVFRVAVKTFAAQSRRQTERERFPLQGWEGWGAIDTLSGPNVKQLGGSLLGDYASLFFFGTTSVEKRAISFVALAHELTRLDAYVAVLGAPTDNLLCEIQTDSGGSPSGIILASQSVPGSSLAALNGSPATSFAGLGLTPGATYWIVLHRSGAADDSNFYGWVKGTGSSKEFSGSWAATGGVIADVVFEMPPGSRSFYGVKRNLGPSPPLVILPLPSQQQTRVGVCGLTPVVRRQQAQQRASRIVRGTPIVETGGVGAISPGGLLDGNTGNGFGSSAASAERATSFVPSVNVTAISLAVFLRRSGSPSDNAVVTLQTDSGGSPSGTILATLTVPAGSLTTTLARFVGTFSVPLTAGTTYWVVCARDGAFDASNFYTTGRSAGSGGNPNYPAQIFSTGAWVAQPNSIPNYFSLLAAGDTLAAYASTIGPQPPLVIDPASAAGPPVETTITVAAVKTRPRRTTSLYTVALDLFPLAVPTTPGQLVVAAHEARTRPRPVRSSLPLTLAAASTFIAPPISVTLQDNRVRGFGRRHFPSVVLNPPTVLQTFSGPEILLQAVQTRAQRQRRRLPGSFLSPPATLEPETVALAERQIRVTLARTRPRVTTRRLAPPTVLQVFAGTATPRVQTRPRATRRLLAAPATLQPYAVTLAEDTIRVALTRTRPRHTVGTKLSYVVYQQTTEITVAIVRTRPRPTRHSLTAITYPQTGVGFQHLVRTRPRPTTRFLLPPATLQPYAVTVAEDTVRVTVARTRPRPTTRRLAPPTVLQTFAAPRTPLVRIRPRHTVAFVAPPATLEPEAVSLAEREIRVVLTRTRPRHTLGTRLSYVVYPQTSKIAVALTRTRPRPTIHRLTAVSYAATSEITVSLARTRPRPPTRRLGPPIFYAATSEITVALTRARPRPTTRFLAPPTTLQTFGPPVESEIAVRVPADDRARRKPRSIQIQPVTYPAASEIAVTLARIRPRPTRRFLTAVTYPETSEITVALVRARSRPLTRFVAPPATLQPYAVTLAEDTVRVTAVRTRPRHTLGTRLIPPTALRTFAGPAVALTHTRPRPTLRRLGPPTVVRVPSVEQREDTITVALIHTRPRPTEKFIVPPLVKTFPPVVLTLLPAHVVKTRPRPTTRFLRAPTVVIPLPTLRMQTIAVATVRTRPRPTRHSLTPLAFYRQTSKIQVVLARTRPRPTAKRLQPPIFYKQTSDITVVLARTRPRPTTRILTAVRYEQATEIAVAVTRIRPRPTRHFLAPPTVLQTFGPPVEVEIAVRTPLEDRARRRPRSFAIQPVTYAAQSELAVTLTRTRPRPTRSILRPPAAVRAFVAAPVTVISVRSRPRRTHSFLLPPTAVRTFTAQPIQVATVTTRPRPTTARIEPPTRLRPVETTLRVALARTRPRRVHPIIPTVLVEAEPPVVTTITVALAHTRPRPTRSILRPPATLRRVVVAFIAPPIQVATVTTRPPRTHVFRVTPFPFFRGRDGFTTSTLIPSAMGTDSSIAATGGAVSAVIGDSADSAVIATTNADIEDTLADGGEILDRPGGLT